MKTFELQVAYREQREGVGVGPLLFGRLEVEDSPRMEAETRALFEGQGFLVVEVRRLRVVLKEWQSVFDREEAAEFLRYNDKSIDSLMARNVLPKPVSQPGQPKGYPRFSRGHLEKAIERMMAYAAPTVIAGGKAA